MARLLCLGLGLASAFVAPGGDRAPLTRVREFGQGEPGISPNDPGVLAPLVTDRQRTIKLADMPGALPPVGVFDPFDLAGELTDSSLRWYRAAELKHGRVCMLAFTGWWLQNCLHFTFGGKLSYDGTTFKSLDGLDIIKEWQGVPDSGRAQILGAIGVLEFVTEAYTRPHYVYGGMDNDSNSARFWPFNSPKFGTDKLRADKAKFLAQQNKELQNGRLAMLGTASLFAAHFYPGSVPLLNSATI